MGLKTDGTVWAWGANESGQLGDSTTKQRLRPKQVKMRSSPLPGTPTNILTSAGPSNITVSWSQVPEATSYNIEYNDPRTPFNPGAGPPAPSVIACVVSPYIMTDLIPDASYTPTVVAFNGYGESRAAGPSATPTNGSGGGGGGGDKCSFTKDACCAGSPGVSSLSCALVQSYVNACGCPAGTTNLGPHGDGTTWCECP